MAFIQQAFNKLVIQVWTLGNGMAFTVHMPYQVAEKVAASNVPISGPITWMKN